MQLGFNLSRALFQIEVLLRPGGRREDVLAPALGMTLLNLIFFPHHMWLSRGRDRAFVEQELVSGRNLLDWETAAQSEAGRMTRLTRFLPKLSPVLALAIAMGLWAGAPDALFAAAPILCCGRWLRRRSRG